MNILILHGIGGHAGIHWQGWLGDTLASRGDAVAMPDLPFPNHPDRQQWLRTSLDELSKFEPGQTIIVGHSLGVATALDCIEKAKQPFAGLVSVSGFAYDYGSELNGYFMRARSVDFSRVRQNVKSACVLYGDNDPYVTQAALGRLASDLHVKPEIIKDGGHLNADAGFSQFPLLLELVLGITRTGSAS
jgi:predicted alpha/beta hydrolase family esterase